MQDSKDVSTPGYSNLTLGLDQIGKQSTFEYRSAIGSLFHLVNCTRPDISFPVAYASRYQSCYGQTEITAVKRILQYLNCTKSLGLCYERPANFAGLELSVYVDASHGPQGDKSTTGYVIFINGNPVSWKSQKQSITAKSAAESEYVALSSAVSELVFIYQLLCELGFEVPTPIPVFEDNTAAIKISSNPTKKSKVKQVNINHHFVRDYVEFGIIEVKHLPSSVQVADLLTKNLGASVFQDLVKNLNLQALG
jgi:hypothetical protein